MQSTLSLLNLAAETVSQLLTTGSAQRQRAQNVSTGFIADNAARTIWPQRTARTSVAAAGPSLTPAQLHPAIHFATPLDLEASLI